MGNSFLQKPAALGLIAEPDRRRDVRRRPPSSRLARGQWARACVRAFFRLFGIFFFFFYVARVGGDDACEGKWVAEGYEVIIMDGVGYD